MILITPLALDRHDLPTVAGLIIESAPELFSAMFGRRAGVILPELIRRLHNRYSHRYIWVAETDDGPDPHVVGIVTAIPTEHLHDNTDYAAVLNRWQRLRLNMLNTLVLRRVLHQVFPPETLYIGNLAVEPTSQN